jgi:uncharacterized protein (TIGR02266 family)
MNVLDLISEFGVLNDTKLRAGGALPEKDEERWAELKNFYEHLMSRSGLSLPEASPRFSSEDIRQRLGARDRIRVPVETPIVFEHEDRYHTARVVNLSKSGLFVASETLLETGARLTLYLACLGGGDEEFIETKGDVVWCTKRGVPEADLPRGMGIRFVDFSRKAQDKLDAYVVETITKRLGALW